MAISIAIAIIRAMRRILSLFLVCLLALRGLLGDAMAMGLMGEMHAPPAMHEAAGGHHGPAAHSGAEHADHAPQTAHATAANAHCGGDAQPDGQPHQAHAHCTACALCHSPLGQAASAALAAPAAGANHAVPHASRFASAALAQAIKPPIS